MIELRHICKRYPHSTKDTVRDFNLTIKKGEFIVLVGPSGCGKSTMLRMIAGLESITDGEFLIDGKMVNDISPKDRDIAMVFQSYALYPHMSVRDNIGYGLKLRKYSKNDIKIHVDKIAEYLDLSDYLERKPKALSGGQRQRVALGRAMIRTPKMYLMDEPLSNLDAKLRTTTRAEIARMHRAKGGVTVYVTHDQVEAMTMADRIVLMSMGEVQQIGSPKELYENPVNCFVATFMGMPPMALIEGTVDNGWFQSPGMTIKLCQQDADIIQAKDYEGQRVLMGVRSTAIKYGKHYEERWPEAKISIEVVNVEYLGDTTNVFFEAQPGCVVIASIDPAAPVTLDGQLELVVDVTNLHFFDIATQQSIKYEDNCQSRS